MKSILYSTLIFLLCLGGFSAQINRSIPPKPLPERPVNFGEVTEMRLKNGLTVLVVENHKLPTVNVSLSLENGPILEGDNTGIMSFFGDMMRAGTTEHSKSELDEQMDFLGSDFSFRSQRFGVSTLKSQLHPSMAIFTEVLFHPTFSNADELELLKKQEISNLESSSKNPDRIMSRVEDVILYGKNDPYGEYVSEKTLANIKLSDFPEFYQKYFIPNNAYLTFVGDITPKEVEGILNEYFPKWKKNKKFEIPNYPLKKNTSGNYIAFVDLPSATQSVISITNLTNFKKSDPDYFTATMGNELLGGGSYGRLFKNIREDKGWTYGAYSSLRDNYQRLGYFRASAKVRNAVTDSAIHEFMYEINKICKEVPSADELKLKQAEFKGNFVISLERPSTIARFAKVVIEEKLPSHFYKNFTEEIQAVKSSNIPGVMQKYIDPKNLVIIVVGNGAEVVPQLETMGMPIKYFDIYGNEIAKPEFELAVPKNMRVQDVFEKAQQAEGNLSTLKKIKSTYSEYQANSAGNTYFLKKQTMSPNYYSYEIKNIGNNEVLLGIKYNSKQGYGIFKNKIFSLPPALQSRLDKNTYAAEVLNYQNIEKYAKCEVIEKVEGKNAYRVDIDIKGGKQSLFFDYTTGLLLRKSTQIDVNNEMKYWVETYSNYNENYGVQVPKQITIEFEGNKMDFNLVNFQANKNIAMSEFSN